LTYHYHLKGETTNIKSYKECSLRSSLPVPACLRAGPPAVGQGQTGLRENWLGFYPKINRGFWEILWLFSPFVL